MFHFLFDFIIYIIYNSIFGITTETILKKPKSFYEELIKQVNDHHNPETGHYFERAWESVFYPYINSKHVM
jgi:hypothetical protein